MIQTVKTALLGLGNVNRSLLQILIDRQEQIASDYNLHFAIIAVADSSGIAVNDSGFDYKSLLDLKSSGRKVSALKEWISGVAAESITDHCQADLLVEASPVNLQTGQPGLQATKLALKKGWKVVLANKGPLVMAFDELMSIKEKSKAKLAYSATVCGGLPVINVLNRDLKTADFISVQGIFNATSNYVLQELGKGNSMEEAIAEAVRVGAAETDPANDLSGQDTANKLYIIMKTISNFAGTIKDISMEGIQEVDQKMIWRAKQNSETIKLVASAHKENNTWRLAVKPLSLPASSFLGNCNGWEMGIEVKTDLYESICMKNYEAEPLGTAAAVLRDMIDLVKS